MKFVLSCLLVVFLALPILVHSQCYDLSVIDIALDPDPVPIVELNQTTTLSFMFCNDEVEVPNDPSGNTSMSICANNLSPVAAPSGSFASNFEWTEFQECWVGRIPDGKVTPTGCGTISMEFEVTANSTETNPTNGIAINIQPASIIVGNTCFDPDDDFISIITFAADTSISTENQNETQDIHIFPNPVSNTLFLQSDNINATATKFELFDVDGKLVLSATHNLIAGDKESISLASLKPGMYLVKLSPDEHVIVEKLVVE